MMSKARIIAYFAAIPAGALKLKVAQEPAESDATMAPASACPPEDSCCMCIEPPMEKFHQEFDAKIEGLKGQIQDLKAKRKELPKPERKEITKKIKELKKERRALKKSVHEKEDELFDEVEGKCIADAMCHDEDEVHETEHTVCDATPDAPGCHAHVAAHEHKCPPLTYFEDGECKPEDTTAAGQEATKTEMAECSPDEEWVADPECDMGGYCMLKGDDTTGDDATDPNYDPAKMAGATGDENATNIGSGDETMPGDVDTTMPPVGDEATMPPMGSDDATAATV